jgi:hypothetical protein
MKERKKERKAIKLKRKEWKERRPEKDKDKVKLVIDCM